MFKKDLGFIIIGVAMDIHNKIGHGFLEKIYKKSIALNLSKLGLQCQIEKQIT